MMPVQGEAVWRRSLSSEHAGEHRQSLNVTHVAVVVQAADTHTLIDRSLQLGSEGTKSLTESPADGVQTGVGPTVSLCPGPVLDSGTGWWLQTPAPKPTQAMTSQSQKALLVVSRGTPRLVTG